MSIAAKIHSARREDDGSVVIYLEPIRKGEVAGQRSLTITNFPEDQSPYGLVGTEIWGGSGQILVGETLWAERTGICQIRLV